MQKSLTSYDILNITDQASQNDIHSAYRRLAKQWHPDLHHGGDNIRANHNFKLLQQAYETIKTPEARTAYNVMLAKQRRAIMINQNKILNDNRPVYRFFQALDALLNPSTQNRKV